MSFFRKFQFAFRGLKWATASQFNFRFHLIAAALVIIAGFYFSVAWWEWMALLLCIAMVLAMEVVNSAIEYLVDIVSPEWNTKAGQIKDMGAGAVLIAAIFSVIIGVMIFLPKLPILWE